MTVLPSSYSLPSLHWWLTLSATEQGTWVAGLGSFAAAVVALWISGKEGRRRDKELKKQSRMSAAYLYTDLAYLVRDVIYVREMLKKMEENSYVQTIENTNEIRTALKSAKSILDRASLELISRLPASVGESVAFGKGGLVFIFDEIDSSLSKLEYELIDAAKIELLGHAKKLEPPITCLIDFLDWFDSAFPDVDKNETSKFLNDMKDRLNS